jgi:hypothetical protein
VNYLEANWRRAPFKRESGAESAAIAASKMQQAITERRLARVPKELLKWRDTLDRAANNVSFRHLLTHLRSGRGIATTRPRVA